MKLKKFYSPFTLFIATLLMINLTNTGIINSSSAHQSVTNI